MFARKCFFAIAYFLVVSLFLGVQYISVPLFISAWASGVIFGFAVAVAMLWLAEQ